MGKFYVTDGTFLLAQGDCQDGMEAEQAFGGHTAYAGDPPPGMRSRPAPPPAYDKLRAQEYPAIGDQLDALWKAVGSLGTDMTDARGMLARIQEVKNKYPKPTNRR